MKKSLLLMVATLAILMQGCTGKLTITKQSQTDTLPVTSTALSAPTEQATLKVTPRWVPTFTEIPFWEPTFVPSRTPVVTLLPKQNYEKNCSTLVAKFPSDKAYSGKAILVGPYTESNINAEYQETFLYNLATQQLSAMSPENTLDIAVSPDGTKYALLDTEDQKEKVYSENGALLGILEKGADPRNIDQWVDNEHLALVIDKQYGSTTYFVYPKDEIIFDVITGQQTRLTSDYPNIDKANARSAWDGNGTAKYDATLTRVVYPGYIDSDYQNQSGQGYILYDLEKKTKLVQFAAGDFFTTPKWFTDGSKFVINETAGDGEFYVISRNGTITKVSTLNDDEKDQSIDNKITSFRYSWSPNGQYLAFWLATIINGNIDSTSLAVLDTYTRKVTDYCIPGEKDITDLSVETSQNYTPVWSPDGNALLTIANLQKNGDFDTILVDLKSGTATKIADNLIPAGWLSN